MFQPTKNFSPIPASTPLRHVLAVAIALAVAACTGGAGLDVPVGPVDHSCHVNPDRGVLGSGCDRHR